jgi:hypothetical protein
MCAFRLYGSKMIMNVGSFMYSVVTNIRPDLCLMFKRCNFCWKKQNRQMWENINMMQEKVHV